MSYEVVSIKKERELEVKKTGRKILKFLKLLILIVLGIVIVFTTVRAIGRAINRKTPAGGISEARYIDVNGTKQWISIYGENKDNPVLLYLHGGPGSATSAYDYAFTRKWADIYTVVTWDQRNCGKSYDEGQNNVALTYELMMSDGKVVTEYVLNYLGKDKLTLLGHSWGSYLGANLAISYPEYYEGYIGTGQLVDMYQNELAFYEVAKSWVGNDSEGLELLGRLSPDRFTEEHFSSRNLLLQKYGYDMMVDGTDYNVIATVVFNPYYSLTDWVDFLQADYSVYMNFLMSDEFKKFSLIDKTEYMVPYYNINGDRDYQTNYEQAQDYFDEIEAPYKKIYIMKNTTHGLLESKSEEFSEILHEIAREQEKVLESCGYFLKKNDAVYSK